MRWTERNMYVKGGGSWTADGREKRVGIGKKRGMEKREGLALPK